MILQKRRAGGSPGAPNTDVILVVKCLVAVVLLTVIPNWMFGSEWYQSFGLGFGDVVGAPLTGDGSGNGLWTPAIAMQVRMTVCLYVAYVIAGIAGACLEVYMPSHEDMKKRASLPPSNGIWSSIIRLLPTRYFAALVVTTCLVRAIVHGTVSSQLTPRKWSSPLQYNLDCIRSMKEGFMKDPPVDSYVPFIAEPECNTVKERGMKMCTENETFKARQTSADTTCIEPPCPAGQVVDTDAVAGPLDAFKRVIPTPAFSTAFPYEDMWRSFYDFPVVIRDTMGLRGARGNMAGKNVWDSMKHKLGVERIIESCARSLLGQRSDQFLVGYELEDKRMTVLDLFASLYKGRFTFDEFVKYNIRMKRVDWDTVSAEEKERINALETRLVDLNLFTLSLDDVPPEHRAMVPKTVFVKNVGWVTSQGMFQKNEYKVDVDKLLADEKEKLIRELAASPKYSGRGYLFDNSVMDTCPQLMNVAPFIQYARDDAMMLDLRKQFGSERDAEHDWPTFFIGPAGGTSSMHQDGMGLGFFLMVVSGRKLFRVIRAEDTVYFAENDPRYNVSLASGPKEFMYSDQGAWRTDLRFQLPVTTNVTIMPREMQMGAPATSSSNGDASGDSYDYLAAATNRQTSAVPMMDKFNLFGPDERWRNLTSNITMYESVLEPGDILYIPRWGHHGGMNLEDGTVSISGNYMHQSIYPLYRELCAMNADSPESLGRFCGWSGLVGFGGNEGSYGHALYTGLNILMVRVRVYVFGPIMTAFRKLTGVIYRWGTPRPVAPGGWNIFYGFDAGAPEECKCCCGFNFRLETDKRGDMLYVMENESAQPNSDALRSPFGWTLPIEARSIYQCGEHLEIFEDLHIPITEVASRMNSCYKRAIWKRYRWMACLGALPAILVSGWILLTRFLERTRSRARLIMKKE